MGTRWHENRRGAHAGGNKLSGIFYTLYCLIYCNG